MALVGYSSLVKLGAAAVSVTAQAMTGSGAGPYQITNAARRVWDPDVTPIFYDGGVAISAGSIASVDYLFGKVTLTAPPAGAVTCDVDYIPMMTIAEGKAYSADFVRELLDTTIFHASNAYRQRIAGLVDASGTIDHLDALATDMDTGGGTMSWNTIMSNGTAKILELYPGQTSIIRMWATFEKVALKATTDGLVEGSCAWKMQARTGTYATAITYGIG